MKVPVKFIILALAIFLAFKAGDNNLGFGIAAAGAFIAFAMIEINELKMYNEMVDAEERETELEK